MYTFSVDISLDVIIMFEINSCVARVKKFSVDILSTCGCAQLHNPCQPSLYISKNPILVDTKVWANRYSTQHNRQ